MHTCTENTNDAQRTKHDDIGSFGIIRSESKRIRK